MKFIKKLVFVLFAAFTVLTSCSTPKKITYFQDMSAKDTAILISASAEVRVKPKDKLSIIVNTQDVRLTNLFNLPISTMRVGGLGSQMTANGEVSGYTVDSEGNIVFPVLGKIKLAGMTREEISSYITEQLQTMELVKDPVVTVEFANLGISVMGEVSHPGRYKIERDDMTILDALSAAGDLTIYGKRERILVMRMVEGKSCVYEVNLCEGKQLYSSPAFYLQQNDVVYVEPNDTRKRHSTVNGNTVRSASFWISIASFITSVIVLINNL